MMSFEDFWNNEVKTTGYSDPWENSYYAGRDAWNAAIDEVIKLLQNARTPLNMNREEAIAKQLTKMKET